MVDFGGVLTSSIGDAFRSFCEREGIDGGRLSQVLHDSYLAEDPASLVARVEVGAITGEEFERELAVVLSEGLAGSIDADRLVERMLEGIEAEPQMIEAVRVVRGRGIRTGLLSNSWSSRQYWIAGYDPEELFDTVVISGEVGLRKPDPRIFRLVADRIEVPPESCVFVDDIEVNVRAAAVVGMHGLLHEDPASTVAELERLFPRPPRRDR